MKTLRIVLVAVVLLCIGRIGVGLIETGDLVNPIDDVRWIVSSVQSSLDAKSPVR
jgi:hypothetical protein